MDSFAQYVIERLQPVGSLEARRMFGAVGLYAGGRFFGIIDNGRLYFKTDEAIRVKYVEAGMEPFRPTEKQTLKKYYEVPPEVVEDSELLVQWAAEAAAVK